METVTKRSVGIEVVKEGMEVALKAAGLNEFTCELFAFEYDEFDCVNIGTKQDWGLSVCFSIGESEKDGNTFAGSMKFPSWQVFEYIDHPGHGWTPPESEDIELGNHLSCWDAIQEVVLKIVKGNVGRALEYFCYKKFDLE